MQTFTAPMPVNSGANIDAIWDAAARFGADAVADHHAGEIAKEKTRLAGEAELRKKQLETEAATKKAQLDRVAKLNEQNYTNARGNIVKQVEEDEKVLTSQAITEEERQSRQQSRDRMLGILQTVDQIRTQGETIIPDQVQNYPQQAYTRAATGAPALRPEYQQAETGKLKSDYYGGEKAQRDVLTPGWNKTDENGNPVGGGSKSSGGTGETTLGKKETDDRVDFSGAALMLPDARARLANAKALLAKTGDISAQEEYRAADANLNTLTKQLVGGYSAMITRIETSTEEPEVRSALQSIKSRLPEGIRARDINSHATIREQIMAALKPLADKVAKGQSLSTDEISIRNGYAKLAEYLRADEPLEFWNVQGGTQAAPQPTKEAGK